MNLEIEYEKLKLEFEAICDENAKIDAELKEVRTALAPLWEKYAEEDGPPSQALDVIKIVVGETLIWNTFVHWTKRTPEMMVSYMNEQFEKWRGEGASEEFQAQILKTRDQLKDLFK